MVKQGPIPAFVHGLWEYIAGIALIAAPLLLNYDHGSATAASIVLGVLLIFLTATTSSSTSLVNQIPLPVHILLDYALAAVLIAAPFLFSFSSESTPTAVFIAGGIVHLLISIGTRYRKDEHPKRGTPKRKKQVARERPPAANRGVRDDEIPEFEPPARDR
jgi:small neutral amino acid transporter SnatA (MarC family)